MEGRIKGKAQQPNLTYVRKAGVDYSGVDEETNPSVATPDSAASIRRAADPAPSEAP